ncbi:MAG TPA: hypothetical protein VG818_04320 [Gemmatimonadaceae bacterium]|nr:hypothetical protein [Gemmatimonadaceae bacterium]
MTPATRHRPPRSGAASDSTAPAPAFWRRVPWWPVVISILVLASMPAAVSPIRDSADFQAIPHVQLTLSPGYIALAPLSDILDTMTLFSSRQHASFLATLLVLYVAVRGWRARKRGTTLLHEIRAGLLSLLALVLVYAAGALLPRPMAALAVDAPFNSQIVVVDFHSHTSYSHDGRPGFGPEQNRAWHRNAGFDAAYVTDHRTMQGADEGMSANPAVAGQGTMLLPGLEAIWKGAHVNILSAGRVYKGLTDAALRDVDDQALQLSSLVVSRAPVLVFTFPGQLKDLHPVTGPGIAGERAIELVDGSPRGLTQDRRQRNVITAIADTLNMAPVAGSDNHGWGYTAAAWTLVPVPGWRGMSADSLAMSIEQVIREQGFNGTQVIERRVANTSVNTWKLVLTVPLVTWRMMTTLSDSERVSWLLWTWAITVLAFAWRRRRA